MQFPIRIIIFFFIAIIVVLLIAGTLGSLFSLTSSKKVKTSHIIEDTYLFTDHDLTVEKLEHEGRINYNFSLN